MKPVVKHLLNALLTLSLITAASIVVSITVPLARPIITLWLPGKPCTLTCYILALLAVTVDSERVILKTVKAIITFLGFTYAITVLSGLQAICILLSFATIIIVNREYRLVALNIVVTCMLLHVLSLG